MAKNQTTYTQTVVPQWYTNYAKDILANQQAISSRPFTPYDSTQRVAGFNPTQQQGFQATQQNAFSYQPTLTQAQTALQGTMGRSTLGAAAPAMAAAADTSALAPAYGALGTAANLTGASVAPTGLAMAQPYLERAGASSVDNVSQFMNPYIENVVNRYGELGARTLQEQLMPAITTKYIQAGQLGGPTRPDTGATGAPSGMMTDAARALRDVQEGVAKQQQQALAEGYNTALGASQAELSRLGALAGTAGGLGFQQQGALAQAGQQIGALGGQYASIGQNQQQIMAQLAGQIASAYGQDTANQMAASGQLAALAQQQQQQGLAGSTALTAVGNQQQALDQAYRDAAYQEFLRASGYDQAQIDNMLKTFQGTATGVPQGSVQLTNNKGPSSSTGANLIGTALTLAGSGALGGK